MRNEDRWDRWARFYVDHPWWWFVIASAVSLVIVLVMGALGVIDLSSAGCG